MGILPQAEDTNNITTCSSREIISDGSVPSMFYRMYLVRRSFNHSQGDLRPSRRPFYERNLGLSTFSPASYRNFVVLVLLVLLLIVARCYAIL